MSERRPKARTVFFRIRDEDYDRLKDLCESQGSCISDLLRAAVDSFLRRDKITEEDVWLSGIPVLAFKVESLSKEIESLRESTVANFHQLNLKLTTASKPSPPPLTSEQEP